MRNPPEPLRRAIAASLLEFPLALQQLPGDTGLRLWLLDRQAGGTPVATEAARRLAEAPPYWSLCWAAGLTVANYIHRNPARVRGCSVVDFGAGSGVVALAAARAGARRVVAVDQDPLALEACRANAAANGVALECAGGLAEVEGPFDLLTATDIFYEAANIALLPLFRARAGRILLGDARRKALAAFGFSLLETVQGTTVPAFGDPQFDRVESTNPCRAGKASFYRGVHATLGNNLDFILTIGLFPRGWPSAAVLVQRQKKKPAALSGRLWRAPRAV